MRELKFRQPIFSGGFNSGNFYKWHYWGFISDGQFASPSGTLENARKTSQQYTGLKDKNGKEIYEGDIMIYPDEPEPRNIYQIIFDGGCFVANCRVGSYFKYMREFILDTIEIIGNIYEDKKLLM